MTIIGTLSQPPAIAGQVGGLPMPAIHSGTAQAACLDGLTLAANASTVDDFYKWMHVRITGGTGAGQERKILASRQNLLSYSEDLRNTAEAGSSRPWLQYEDINTAVESLVASGPDGVSCTVSKLKCASTGASTRAAYQLLATLTDNTAYCMAVDALGLGGPTLALAFGVKNGTFPYAIFNLATGAVTGHSADALAYGSIALTGGWYRYFLAANSMAGGSTCAPNIKLSTTGGGGYAGNGTISSATGETWTMQSSAAKVQSDATGTYLLLDGTVDSYASTPDSAALDITGDLDLRVRVAANDWTPTGFLKFLLTKFSSGQCSYRLDLQTNGALALVWSANGTNTVAYVTSTVPVGVADGSIKWVRATLDVDNGSGGRDIKFWTSDNNATWTQLGTTITQAGVTSVYSGSQRVMLGSGYAGDVNYNFIGKIYKAEVRSGIDGAVVASFDAALANGLNDGILVFGAQMNLGTVPDEYIQTFGAAAVGIQIDRPWLVRPDATSTYEIYLPGATASGALSQPPTIVGTVG